VKGSHTTWPEWAPARCYVCHELITLSGLKALGAVFRFDVAASVGLPRYADCQAPR
jgi:hypothetical protein